MSTVIDLAEQIRTFLSRRFVSCTVERRRIARGRYQYAIVIDVAILKKLSGKNADEINPIVDFVEHVANTLKEIHPERIENNPIYVDEWLDRNRQFGSLITLTLIVFESIS